MKRRPWPPRSIGHRIAVRRRPSNPRAWSQPLPGRSSRWPQIRGPVARERPDTSGARNRIVRTGWCGDEGHARPRRWRRVARLDLCLVFLGAARPHGAAHAGLALKRGDRLFHLLFRAQRAKTERTCLLHRHTKGHPVMLETHNEQFDLAAADLAGFGAKDAPDAMGRYTTKSSSLKAASVFFDIVCSLLGPAHGLIAGCSGRVLPAISWSQALSPDVRAKTPLPPTGPPLALRNEVRTG